MKDAHSTDGAEIVQRHKGKKDLQYPLASIAEFVSAMDDGIFLVFSNALETNPA